MPNSLRLFSPLSGWRTPCQPMRRLSMMVIVVTHFLIAVLLTKVSTNTDRKMQATPVWLNLMFKPPAPADLALEAVLRPRPDAKPRLTIQVPSAPNDAPADPPTPVPMTAAEAPQVAPSITVAPPHSSSAPAVSSAPSDTLSPQSGRVAAPRLIPSAALQYLQAPVLEYPRQSRRNGEQGRVVVRVYIDETGTPGVVEIDQSCGHPRLDDAAIAAVRKARFKPYFEAGRAIPGWALVPAVFNLDRSL